MKRWRSRLPIILLSVVAAAAFVVQTGLIWRGRVGRRGKVQFVIRPKGAQMDIVMTAKR